jgi:hypothetical protein
MIFFQKLTSVCVVAGMALWAAEVNTVDETRFGPRKAFQLEAGKDSFGWRSHGVVEVLIGSGGTKMYPLPQSTSEDYAKLRPADIKMNPLSATANNYDREEVIGPHQAVGDRLWFGNNFYDGEGDRGVGAFGYFDATTRKYQMFSPPEVAPYEVSAILVEQDMVWLGLDHFGEDISKFPGGLVRWNRSTHQVRRYPIEFVVSEIAREGESLRMTTSGGYALLTGDIVHRFSVRTDAGGKTETTPVDKFPPPPSHHALL